jgi:hypothetical protein
MTKRIKITMEMIMRTIMWTMRSKEDDDDDDKDLGNEENED